MSDRVAAAAAGIIGAYTKKDGEAPSDCCPTAAVRIMRLRRLTIAKESSTHCAYWSFFASAAAPLLFSAPAEVSSSSMRTPPAERAAVCGASLRTQESSHSVLTLCRARDQDAEKAQAQLCQLSELVITASGPPASRLWKTRSLTTR